MNKKLIKRVINIFIVVCVIVMIYSLFNIVMWYIGVKRNKAIQSEINEIIDTSSDDKEEIDFAKLKEKNKEIVAYLKVNNTNIDYLVVKGQDNKFYLRHNLYKEYSFPGWIFMDYRNKLDGKDKNLIIYGHNNKEGIMFGSLKNIITEEWYKNEDNHIINLVFEDRILTYHVFSTYSIKLEEYYISTNFKNNNEFNKFVNTLKSRSVYDYGVEVNGEDRILTLSTCAGNGKNRMVLHAKLEEETLTYSSTS